VATGESVVAVFFVSLPLIFFGETRMFKIWLKSLLAIAVGIVIESAAQAGTINLAATQDTYVYGFLSTTSGAALSGFFPGIFAVANDSPLPHSINSFVEFGGLGTSGITAAQVSSATLTLTVGPNPGFGPSPSASAPVTVDLFAAASAWDTSVTWATQPATVTAPPGLSAQQTDNDPAIATISFNVTSFVENWLGGSLANNGFILTQDNSGAQSLAFDSMSAPRGQPLLTINTFATPEPGSLALAGLAAGTIGLWQIGRRRQGVRGA
jgi:hypothetical protein